MGWHVIRRRAYIRSGVGLLAHREEKAACSFFRRPRDTVRGMHANLPQVFKICPPWGQHVWGMVRMFNKWKYNNYDSFSSCWVWSKCTHRPRCTAWHFDTTNSTCVYILYACRHHIQHSLLQPGQCLHEKGCNLTMEQTPANATLRGRCGTV